MKRSKAFLGVTTCLLAVVGLAATKAKFTGLNPYYWTAQGNPNQGACILDQITNPPTYTTVTTGNPARLTTRYGGFFFGVTRKIYITSDCLMPAYVGTR
jgi:hypothetical protein